MKNLLCRRCNRPLKDPISIKRGFGPTCFTKVIQEDTETGSRFKQLEKEITILKKQIYAIQTFPSSHQTTGSIMMPVPRNLPPVPNGKKKSPNSIPILAGGWDIGELKNNELFLKMQSLANTNG